MKSVNCSPLNEMPLRGLPLAFRSSAAGGRCERCEGNGCEKLEMYPSRDIYATCGEKIDALAGDSCRQISRQDHPRC